MLISLLIVNKCSEVVKKKSQNISRVREADKRLDLDLNNKRIKFL